MDWLATLVSVRSSILASYQGTEWLRAQLTALVALRLVYVDAIGSPSHACSWESG